MRNHRKVKTLRNKFGQILGYAFWSMMLEYLTEQDGNQMEYSDLEIEMFSAELGADIDTVRSMIAHCVNIELLFSKDGFLFSESLNLELDPVYKKRNRAREDSATKYRRNNGTFGKSVTEKPEEGKISVTEKPQSRVEYSRVENKVTKVTMDKELRDLYKKIDNQDMNQIAEFIKKHKPEFSAPYVDLWNLFAIKNNKPKVIDLVGARRGKLASRLKDPVFDFVLILKRARSQTFAMESNWFNFTWIINNDSNFRKILEGHYYKNEEEKKAHFNPQKTDVNFAYPNPTDIA